ncbi:hypothetical protein CRP01_34490 [Flavilitoribacter nigricans DSM 23189 = NBRC 102662]|uniref:Uncharacterized protein n=1 Tax=Flavilitoribacter nigricans (strain ATCC 23147 / DSM 23189 / NBRC 102662 / NCIMB 1420 / SS-2) TaxID=1122177 RepID=A0A2D0N062_FLAN2|nr:hypothetical protein CRP01_34490 [Flavilitoribacter nigricans DSM 23189 = NBRC 102662]
MLQRDGRHLFQQETVHRTTWFGGRFVREQKKINFSKRVLFPIKNRYITENLVNLFYWNRNKIYFADANLSRVVAVTGGSYPPQFNECEDCNMKINR